MDEQRARVQDDLRGLLDGEVRCDDLFVQLYASDASIYQIRPLGVVLPRTSADVVALVEYARDNHLPLHARGAGTGLAGESLGPGLVVDFSKHLRRVLAVDHDRVRVQPGVVLERLNAHLAASGRFVGPDPAMSQVTTLGSLVAIDAAGSHWLKYGSARRHVLEVEAVLASGDLVRLGREPLVNLVSNDEHFAKRTLINELAPLLASESERIARHRPRSRVNRSGYALHEVLGDDTLDVARLLTGSEGTLALFTEVTLATQPLPRHRSVAMLFFDRLESACLAVPDILSFEPSACDLVDRRHISLARDTQPRYELLIPAQTEALLLVELDGDDKAQLRDRQQRLIDVVWRKRRRAFDARVASDDLEFEFFWQLARKVVSTLHRLKGSTRPLPFIEDIAVPPDALSRVVVNLQNVLKRHQVTASLFGHVGHGQLHVRPFMDLSDPTQVRRIEELAADVYAEVWAVGGTISGEHGDGLSRTAFVARQYGPLYEVFREVKRIFDPHNIFNPGKVVGDDPHLMQRNLRPVSLPWQMPAGGEPRSERGPQGQAVDASAPHPPGSRLQSPDRSAPRATVRYVDREPAAAVRDITERATAEGATAERATAEHATAERATAEYTTAEHATAERAASECATAERAAADPPAVDTTAPEPRFPETTAVEPAVDDRPPLPRELVELQLHWNAEDLALAARACNGCGVCRTQAPGTRMCPIFRFEPREEASPRAKANLIRGVLTGQLDPTTLARDEFKAIADLCVNCQMCRVECPAEVDIPGMMVEAKAAYVASNGLRLVDWLLAHIDWVSGLGSHVAAAANWALGNRQARWLLEKTTGIAQGRKLPRFARQSFMRLARKRRLTRPTRRSGEKVLYFVDTYANYHDPQLAEALVAILEHNGVAVYVHPQQAGSGMSLVSMGALDAARRVAAHNVPLLAEAVRQGYHVVASEPSAALALVREYPRLLDDDDARLVAQNTSEAGQYLWRMHRSGKLHLDLQPVHAQVAYHLPCHLRALEVGTPGEHLLRLIPSLRVHRTEKGCSGMAGTFGLKRQNFRASLRAGRDLIASLREPGLHAGATECCTCKMQMEQGTTKPTIHPLKLLAMAYGVMPRLDVVLAQRSEERLVT